MTVRTAGRAGAGRAAAARATAAVLAAAVIALTGCTAGGGSTAAAGPAVAAGAAQDATAVQSTGAVAALPVAQLGAAAIPHLADGVTPPTSRWYSSLAFSDPAVPVYPSPLAFLATPDGFTVQRPPVSVSATSISASFTGGLHIGLGGTDCRVVRADPVSVTIEYTDAGASVPRARVTIAEGSPIVAVAAEADLAVALPGSPTPVAPERGRSRSTG